VSSPVLTSAFTCSLPRAEAATVPAVTVMVFFKIQRRLTGAPLIALLMLLAIGSLILCPPFFRLDL
jgi:hypothetical protein